MTKKKPPIPAIDGGLIETHCHLDSLTQAPLIEILDKAAAVGVNKLLTIAVSAENLAIVRRIVTDHGQIFGSQGVHPHDADGFSDTVAHEIIQGLKLRKIVAVGEIGLDYFYDHSERGKQRDVFIRQIEIAVTEDYPVIIHSREADEDTRDILQDFAGKLRGVIHSFTSGMALAEFSLEMGLYLGFNGIITFNKAENVREVLRATPVERLLLETDSPYLTPVPYRGRENAPFYLPFVADKVADIKALTVPELVRHANRNATALFGF